MEHTLPKHIGRYRVDRLLGAGAMGFVYLGYDPRLDRQVAIKTLRELHLDPEAHARFLARFHNEARAAARLQHPCIVQVYDVGEDPEVGPFLVIEYVPGTTLDQLLRDRGPLEPAAVVRMAEQVAAALDAAHEAGVLHRDIKPHNLLVTEDGRTKLADFGVARLPDAALTREGQFLGTPAYAAPETLSEGAYSPRSDLFSFAAVLYEAITGVRPFQGDEAMAVAHKVMHEPPPPLSEVAKGPSVPPEVERVVLGALAKDPARRPAHCGELAAALRAAYEQTGTVLPEEAGFRPDTGEVRLSRTQRRGPDPAHRRRAGLLWAGAAASLGAGLLAVAALGGGEASPPPLPFDGGVARGVTATGPAPVVALDGGAVREVSADAPAAEPAPTPASPMDGGTEAKADGGSAQAAERDELAAMTPHEREEAAKDALQAARRALEQGDHAAARQALERARRFDPTNPDIDAVAEWMASEAP